MNSLRTQQYASFEAAARAAVPYYRAVITPTNRFFRADSMEYHLDHDFKEPSAYVTGITFYDDMSLDLVRFLTVALIPEHPFAREALLLAKCNREAGEVESISIAHPGTMEVVDVGAFTMQVIENARLTLEAAAAYGVPHLPQKSQPTALD